MKTDYETTGKLYPKLHAYVRGEYFGTSEQFKTAQNYKLWLCQVKGFAFSEITVNKNA